MNPYVQFSRFSIGFGWGQCSAVFQHSGLLPVVHNSFNGIVGERVLVHQVLNGFPVSKIPADAFVPFADIALVSGGFTPGLSFIPGRDINGFAGNITLNLLQETFRKNLPCVSVSHSFSFHSARFLRDAGKHAVLTLSPCSGRIVRQHSRQGYTVFFCKCFWHILCQFSSSSRI